MISRRALLGGAGALATVGAGPAYVYKLQAQQIASDTYVIRGADAAFDRANGGAIGNIAFIDTPGGAVIIDAGPSARFGAQLRKFVETTTGKAVARVYLTHFHPDHIFGAQAFDAATVAATPALAASIRSEAGSFSDGMYRLLGDWMRGTDVVVPGHSITAEAESFASHRIRALPLEGHSSTDLALLDEATGTLFAGDLVFLDRAPATPHADLAKWRAALGTLEALPHARTVPGHGPVHEGTRGIAQTRAWLLWLERTLRGALDRGLDMTEAMALPIPQEFASMALARYELHRSVAHLYPALEAELLPRVDGT